MKVKRCMLIVYVLGSVGDMDCLRRHCIPRKARVSRLARSYQLAIRLQPHFRSSVAVSSCGHSLYMLGPLCKLNSSRAILY